MVRHWRLLLAPLYFQNSHLAVDLFFVISGFVIPHAYERRLQAGLSAPWFLWLRVVRLYPLYLLGALSGAGFVFAHLAWGHFPSAWSAGRFAATLAATVGLAPWPGPPAEGGWLYPFEPVAWSLLFELAANLAYGLAWRRLCDWRVLIAVVAVCAAALVGCGLYFHTLDIGPNLMTWPGGLVRALFSFSAGVLIFRLHKAGRLPRLKAPPLLLVALLIGAAALAPRGEWGTAYQLAVVLLVFPAVIAAGVQTQAGPRLAPLFGFLGLASYGLYALHYAVPAYLTSLDAKLLHLGLTGWAPASGLAVLALLIAFVAWIDRFYDRPVRARLLALTARG